MRPRTLTDASADVSPRAVHTSVGRSDMFILDRRNSHLMGIETVAAAAIYLLSTIAVRVIEKKWKRRRWWMLAINRNRTK
ncbi:Uncharacterized protein OBRU01_04569 [Operophtera brumata]|uniref:Uncharacterized protein n=1 Tax=Operophtera brumata TaxID=104452 RepID=A0A0L7LNQ1_OPEBR|nr:Uncharacterized protein OBRU01_04569 [Operophtera brumata]